MENGKKWGNEMDILKERFERTQKGNLNDFHGMTDSEEVDRLEGFHGAPINFGSADVQVFKPFPDALKYIEEELDIGTEQVFCPQKGRPEITEYVAEKLSEYTGAYIDPKKNIILTPGAMGAAFIHWKRQKRSLIWRKNIR